MENKKTVRRRVRSGPVSREEAERLDEIRRNVLQEFPPAPEGTEREVVSSPPKTCVPLNVRNLRVILTEAAALDEVGAMRIRINESLELLDESAMAD
jgi:hypothetical protein